MKILLVHNFYRSVTPSGENEIFKNENALLVSRGHEVRTFLRHSDQIASGVNGLLRGALATSWNPWMASEIRRVVKEFRPDVVHAHNTFPLVSPAIFHAVGNLAPRVLTLHNYRLFCPAGMLIRPDGTVCTSCLRERSVGPSLRYGCYRKSRAATLPLAISVALHRRLGTWTEHVDAFLAGTEFQRSLLIESGLPPDVVFVKPNFLPGNPTPLEWSQRQNSVVFAGRLSMEKGADLAVEAWANWGASAPQLVMLGEGPLRGELEKRAAGCNILFKGQRSTHETQEEIAKARLVILPSRAFECFPMVIAEAFAHGTPIGVSTVGPLPTIVKDGLNGVTFTPGSAAALEDKVRSLWKQPERFKLLAEEARRSFDRDYNQDHNHDLLMDFYGQAQQIHRNRGIRYSTS